MSSSKVSFTIRRPTPVSRGDSGTDSTPEPNFKVPALPKHLAAPSNGGSPLGSPAPSPAPRRRNPRSQEKDSSDEEDEEADELVTGFDQFGVQRCVPLPLPPPLDRAEPQLTAAFSHIHNPFRHHANRLHEKRKAPEGPLVIPALKNKDWRELARKRKALYVPPQAAATGKDGSVGGLGTRDTINSGPQLSGLQVNKRVRLDEDGESAHSTPPPDDDSQPEKGEAKREEETEDTRALRAILASATSGDDPNESRIDAIPLAAPAPSEDDVYKQDVEELPESASLEDYERVPVSQFGAALLRGMGWKEGMAASRKNRGPVEPYLPQSRPALLGIGAKEREVFDDGSKKKGKGKPERRYVPVIKRERAKDEEDGERRRSPSPDRQRDRDDRDRRDRDSYAKEKERDRDRRRDDREDRRRSDRDYEYERDKDRRRDRRDDEYESSRRDRDRRRDRSPDRHESDRRRDKERDRRR